MHNTARSILTFVCLVALVIAALRWVGWADTPDWVGHFFIGFAVAALIAFIGAPIQRKTGAQANREHYRNAAGVQVHKSRNDV